MNKILRLAYANIRKNKGQSLSFLIIAFISALLLNLGLVTLSDYEKSFDQKAARLNAPDVTLTVSASAPSFASSFLRTLQEDSRVSQAQMRPVLVARSEFRYTEGINSRKAAFFDRSGTSELGKASVLEEIESPDKNAIYLPYLFKVGGGYQTGDTFTITLLTSTNGEQEFTYTVAGFYEDIFFSTLNSTITGFLLNHESYAELEQALLGEASGTLFSIQTKNAADNESLMSEYRNKLGEQVVGNVLLDSNHYATLKSARTVTSSIGSSIILGFSFLLMLVSLIVVNFRIRNSLEEEIRNIGALKAIGYTSRQLIGSFLLQFIVLTLAGSVPGILCSVPVLPSLAAMFAAQTGIVWEQSFSFPAAATTLLLMEILAGGVAFASAIRIRKLPPIVALRTGVLTHSFRRNSIPLDKARRPLTFAMAGKQLARNHRQNALIGLTVAVVAFAASFAGVLYYNVNINSDVFIRMVAGETPHAQLYTADEESARRLLEKANSLDEVKAAFFFSTASVRCEESAEATAYILDEYELTGNKDWLYQGSFPRYENEVAVGGLLAQSLGKEIGDTLQIANGDTQKEFLITGLIQGSSNMGRDLCLNQTAFRSISEDYVPTVVSLYFHDQQNTASVLNKLEQTERGLSTVNTDEIIRSSMSTYRGIVAILAVVIGVVILIIIGLVLYLVIKTLLIRKKREFGIQKAIGFTTRQLVLQNAMAFLPVIAFGSLIGCAAGFWALNPFFSMLFSGIGIMKVPFIISIPLLTGIFLFIIGFGFLISVLVSSKIKKISPYTLMSD